MASKKLSPVVVPVAVGLVGAVAGYFLAKRQPVAPAGQVFFWGNNPYALPYSIDPEPYSAGATWTGGLNWGPARIPYGMI